MTQIGNKLSELKCALQELETAVQQPRDERHSIEQVLDRFPLVITGLSSVLHEILASQGCVATQLHDRFSEAYYRGWLKGEFSIWIRLLSDYQQIKEEDVHGTKARAVSQDVRACSCIMWETYELLTARFRWQTQTVARPVVPANPISFAAQAPN